MTNKVVINDDLMDDGERLTCRAGIHTDRSDYRIALRRQQLIHAADELVRIVQRAALGQQSLIQ